MKLNYKEFGEGQPLIILHGLLGSLDNWQTLAKRFANNFRVFIVDQRNHGQSLHSDEMDYDLLTDDLSEFIKEKSIEKPVLIGHSMGGKTVMKYALEKSDSVEALISVDMSPREYSIQHDYILNALISVDLEKAKSRKQVEEILMSKLNNIGIVLFLTKNIYWIEKEKLAFRFNLDALYNNLDLISSWPQITGSFEGKTLFIRGGKSEYITDNEPNIQAYFPNSKIVTLDAGHWVHAEKQDEFYSTVIDFLR